MAEGTDVSSLSPVITLAPGATITSKHAGVQDFSQQVEYTVICEDGSTVTYDLNFYSKYFHFYFENEKFVLSFAA